MQSPTKACPFCNGSGRCANCKGTGIRLVRKGWFSFERLKACKACTGTATCQLCVGKGTLRILS